MPGFHARDYQLKALEAIVEGFRDHWSLLLVIPTGGGKTVVFSSLVKRYVTEGKRVLIIAHREELLAQAQDKLLRSQGVIADLERAGNRASLGASCVVGSIQTLCRDKRLLRWPPHHFDLIIIDEAHRTLATTYKKVIHHFRPRAQLLGVTATPDRSDKKSLGQIYEEVAYEISLKELIEQRYLASIRVKTFPIDLDLSDVRIRQGDYDVSDLGHALEPLLYPIAKAFAEEIQERKKVLVFLPLCDISRDFANLLVHEFGIAARHIDGTSPDRKHILEQYSAGHIQVLCNAMLLTEGYDEPGIDTVMCLRPTKSRALYSQMIGRGTRIHKDKHHLLILDPLWMSETHSLVKPAHLVAETEEDAREAHQQLVEADLIPGGGDGALDLMEMVHSATESRLEKIRERLEEKKRIAAKKFDPITYAMDVMESPVMAEYQPTMGWERAPATSKQLEILTKEGFEPEDIRCRGHASKLLDCIFHRRQMGLATTKQLFHLHKLGVPNANALTMDEASAELSARWGSQSTYVRAPKPAAPSRPPRRRDMFAEFAATRDE